MVGTVGWVVVQVCAHIDSCKLSKFEKIAAAKLLNVATAKKIL